MRILSVNYEYPPVGGGGGVAAANLANALVQRGHSVDYVTTLTKGLPRFETLNGVSIYREPVMARRELHTASIISMLSYPPVAIYRGCQLAKVREYDIIHSHFAIPSGPAGYFLSKKLNLPHILSIYGGDIYDPSKPYSPHKHPLLHRVVKKVLFQANAIVGESQDICSRAKQYYQPRSQICRIPLGFAAPAINEISRESLGLKNGKKYVVAVSRLIPRKDYDTLIQAFHTAAVPDLKLIIIGDGPERTRLELLVKSLQRESDISFVGAVSDNLKFSYLKAADIFGLSPSHEGYGIVFQEAMYFGLPIVTTNNGGQTDFLQQDQNALLVKPGDIKGFADSLRRCMQDDALRSAMRNNNIKAIQSQMIDAIAINYEELFYQVIEEARTFK